jgi:HSP20 family protein
MPTVDLSETAKEIIVNAENPGVEAKDIDVNLAGDLLTIKGERKRERERKLRSAQGDSSNVTQDL